MRPPSCVCREKVARGARTERAEKELEMDGLVISPWGLFLQAGPVGKSVMALLLLLSIWCWVLIAEGAYAAVRLRGAMRAFRAGKPAPLIAPILAAGSEAARHDVGDESRAEARGRVEQAMSRVARALLRKLEGGLPSLAIISSIAPFVGLFGTVWGIMTSFAAIAEAKDTSLAVVAPGIAEALATTAFGLAAAIPASIGYTRIGAMLAFASGELADWIEERAGQALLRLERSAKEAA